MTRSQRVGLVVPSSNTTMEIEVPKLLDPERAGGLSFHSSRMKMTTVSVEELAAMNDQAARCVAELADARCDVIAYACLVAVMVQGAGAHRRIESELSTTAAGDGRPVPIVSSAGALVEALHEIDASRIAMVTPYLPALTDLVVEYLFAEGVTTSSVVSLGIDDNYEVGCIPGDMVAEAVTRLNLDGIDALVLSACVQMPSLALMKGTRAQVAVPVLSASTATAAHVADRLGIERPPLIQALFGDERRVAQS